MIVEGCDLANSVWRGASIDRTEFIDCRLTGLDVAEASLRHVAVRQGGGSLISFRFAEVKNSRFEDCVLTEADFHGARLPGVVVRGSDLRGASLYG
ncbi:MAG: pentapeptide repeat-containing protein, partial [Candidatus Rokuibacteriota bacterium]